MVLSLPSQSDRVPPSLLLWPGAPHPGLASSLVLNDLPRMWGVIRHKVPCDTDTPYSTCYTRYLQKTAIACGRLISVSVMCVDASSSRLFKGSAPQNGGYRVH